MKRTIIMTSLLPLVVLVGCAAGPADPGVASASGSTAAASPAAAGSGTEDPAERGRQFAQCMRDHGIDMPDPDPNGPTSFSLSGGADEHQKFEEANKACEEFAPGKGGETTQVDPAVMEKMRQFSQCMRDHGLADFPDPQTEGGGVRVELGGKLDPQSDEFKAAEQACKDLAPPPAGGGTEVHQENGGGGGAGGGA